MTSGENQSQTDSQDFHNTIPNEDCSNPQGQPQNSHNVHMD
ncbi:unnamed protein product [marine sediment metagenome]|uniref:Uncharacterized protein n=1 Tax=marine sediment metagenome TaxID=412755 RepID=X1N693_9ZZZZ